MVGSNDVSRGDCVLVYVLGRMSKEMANMATLRLINDFLNSPPVLTVLRILVLLCAVCLWMLGGYCLQVAHRPIQGVINCVLGVAMGFFVIATMNW